MSTKNYTASTVLNHSPRKTRLIINPIRGKKLDEAFLILKSMNKPKAKKITALLSSAASNLGLTEADYSSHIVSHIVAEESSILYRFMPRARGSAGKLRRRQTRIKALLSKAK